MKPTTRWPHTPLSKRKRKGKKIISVFNEFDRDPISVSWHNHHLLNMLWACVLVGNLGRSKYLQLFREIVENSEVSIGGDPYARLSHDYISTLDQLTFENIFAPAIEDKDIAMFASAITSVDSMPDSHLWKKAFPNPDNASEHFYILAHGVGTCFNRRSQEATDVQWINLLFRKKHNKINFASHMTNLKNQIEVYPNCKDLEDVESLIRGVGLICYGADKELKGKSKIADFPTEAVWTEFLEKTPCIRPETKKFSMKPREVLFKEVTDIIDDVVLLFHKYLQSEHADPKFEVSFGIALYSLSIAVEISQTPFSCWATGRILLRTIVESLITLSFLKKKNDRNLWLAYKIYGSGRSALAFLKYIDQEEIPNFVDVDKLEKLANDEAWFETFDIDLGSWAKKSIRSMAEDAEVMDIYNQYYDVTSGFTHAQWTSVQDAVFANCLNPLHKFHKIPMMFEPMPCVLDDCCKLCNFLLDELGDMYTNEIPRITWKSS